MASTEVTEDDILIAKKILSASSRLDVPALKILLKGGSANVRDPSTGTAPLHAAIEACEVDGTVNKEKEQSALVIVRLLLENGAIWNDLNNANETPGCIAYRLGLDKIYETMVDSGVRAEILLTRMEELGLMVDNEPEVDADPTGDESEPPRAKRRKTADFTANDEEYDVSKSNMAYLSSELRFKPGILLDESDNAVMMEWETQIMTRHAETLLPTSRLRSMNVGHGLGIVDNAILARNPAMHHIVEAHPQVIEKLRKEGWFDKPNVTVHEGRWQDVLPTLVNEGVLLDAIYYDTFAEDYAALKEFFTEYVIQLLDENGRFGWYNGLGADRQICYDVYTKVSSDRSHGLNVTKTLQVAEMDLYGAGFDTEWEEIAVPKGLHGSKQWEGTRRPYWTLDVYRLPVNRFISTQDD